MMIDDKKESLCEELSLNGNDISNEHEVYLKKIKRSTRRVVTCRCLILIVFMADCSRFKMYRSFLDIKSKQSSRFIYIFI